MTKSSPRAEELNELLAFSLFELHLFIVCVCTCPLFSFPFWKAPFTSCVCVSTEVRGQFCGVGFILPLCGSWDLTQVSGLVVSSFSHWAIPPA